MSSIKRYIAEVMATPTPPEATIRLIDALRDYIAAHDAVGSDLLDEGQITLPQWNDWRFGNERARYTDMIAELEREEIDPTLKGLLDV